MPTRLRDSEHRPVDGVRGDSEPAALPDRPHVPAHNPAELSALPEETGLRWVVDPITLKRRWVVNPDSREDQPLRPTTTKRRRYRKPLPIARPGNAEAAEDSYVQFTVEEIAELDRQARMFKRNKAQFREWLEDVVLRAMLLDAKIGLEPHRTVGPQGAALSAKSRERVVEQAAKIMDAMEAARGIGANRRRRKGPTMDETPGGAAVAVGTMEEPDEAE